ncbi:MAG: hypothetical protein EA379_07635 [Phycisphaerales bacterium]|nr:MAG: hypothetical protein EA379_07635 [Phycisphaerales bacterium]
MSPVINLALAQPVLFGERSIVGVIDGLLPIAEHESFLNEFNESRIIIEIIGGLGFGDPNNELDVNIRTRASGIIGAAIMDGEPSLPEPLGTGVAPLARGVVASVGLGSGPSDTFVLSNQGITGAILTMADPVTAASFGVAPNEMPDVIVTAVTNVGDFPGDSFISRLHDGIASMFGITLIAPSGDGAEAIDPDDPNSVFRTVGAPATAFNVMGVGASTIVGVDAGNIAYETTAAFSGRGRVDSRDYRSAQPNAPGGFEVIANSRFGVDIIAPGEFLRLPVATGQGEYSRDPELTGDGKTPPPGPGKQEELGSASTAYAAGLIAGAVALLQDGYKAIRQANPINPDPFSELPDFSHFQDRTRLHNTVVRAMLINSCSRSGQWTNVGNQGSLQNEIEPITTQPLDTTEGGGQLNLQFLAQQFQGDPGNGADIPVRYATMDTIITDPQRARIREPISAGGTGGNIVMGLGGGFGGPDPDLAGWNRDPGFPPPDFGGGFRPSPEVFPRPGIPPSGGTPMPPNSDPMLLSAIPINPIGWDHARLGPGFLDYELRFPTAPGDRLVTTLAWNRTQTWAIPNVAAGGTLNLQFDEIALEHENLNLEVWLSDGSGAINTLIGRSNSTWSNVEHVITPLFQSGKYIIRVRWMGRLYNRFNNLPGSDVEYGLAWRIEPGGDLAPPGGLDPLPLVGDINGDGVVDQADVQVLMDNFGSTDFPAADLNNDGVVDFYDLQILLNNIGATN